jgi:hypothetical protein
VHCDLFYLSDAAFFHSARQTSAYQATEVTSTAVAQQVSAVASLLGSSPDEVSETSKLAATAFLKQLANNVDPADLDSASSILGTLGAMSGSTLAAKAVSQATTSTNGRRLLIDFAAKMGNTPVRGCLPPSFRMLACLLAYMLTCLLLWSCRDCWASHTGCCMYALCPAAGSVVCSTLPDPHR